MSTSKKADYQDDITVITTISPNILMTKTIVSGADGHFQVLGYGDARNFSFHRYGINGFDALVVTLNKLTGMKRSCILRATFIGRNPDKSRRLLYPQGDVAATLGHRDRRWLAFDFDDADVSCDVLDGPSVARQLRVQLPTCFHDVACWYSLTASAGIKPGARMRMFFWLDKALGGPTLERWLLGCPVDGAVFRSHQPIYVAHPIFNGGDDFITSRHGVLPGTSDMVAVPEISLGMPDPRCSYVSKRSKEWKWNGPREYLDQVLNSLARCPEAEENEFGSFGRHQGLFDAALRLGSYWEGMELSAEDGRGLIATYGEAIGIKPRECNRIITDAFRKTKPLPPRVAA